MRYERRRICKMSSLGEAVAWAVDAAAAEKVRDFMVGTAVRRATAKASTDNVHVICTRPGNVSQTNNEKSCTARAQV